MTEGPRGTTPTRDWHRCMSANISSIAMCRKVAGLFLLLLLMLDIVQPKATNTKMRVKPPGAANKKPQGKIKGMGGGPGVTQPPTTTTMAPSINSDPDDPYDLDDLPRREATNEERLLQVIFHGYDPIARATVDVSKSVTVRIDFVLLRIHGLEERSQVLTSTGLVIAEWYDDRLVWDPQKFGNLTDVIVKPEQVWLPEVALMNGADELLPEQFDRMRVLLHHDGKLHWEPGGVFRTTCDIDITYFPFDSQNCPLLIGAYSYHSNRVNVTNASTVMLTHDLQPNGEWMVSGSTVEWNVTVLGEFGDGYSHVIFTIHLERRYKFYLMNIVLPCLMLSSLIMVSFLLPPEAGEKISLGISVLLAFTVFLMMIADKIPRTSLAVPLIVIYLMATMTLGTTSICLTVFVLNIHHRSSLTNQKLRPFLRNLFLVQLARLVRCETTPLDLYLKQLKSQRASESNFHSDTSQSCSRHRHKLYNNVNQRTVSNNSSQHFTNSYSRHSLHSLEDPPSPAKKGFSSALLLFIGRFGKTKIVASNGVAPPSSRSVPVAQTEIHVENMGGACRERLSMGRIYSDPRSTRVKSRRRMKTFTDDFEETARSDDWKELAQVLDRTFFCLIGLTMVLSTVLVLLYPYYSSIAVDK